MVVAALKLVASMMVGEGELDRYLMLSVPALLEFCDEVRVRLEGTDSYDYLAGIKGGRLQVLAVGAPDFFEHEGRARQELLDWTLEGEPSHILAVDADEFVSDGQALRAACESDCPIQSLWLEEVWNADDDGLRVRTDGGWQPHGAPVCWRVPDAVDATWRIQDRALACGREPLAIRGLMREGCYEYGGSALLHFGWAREAERAARYERYRVADGGRFHARAHLDSIMWPDSRVGLASREWPAGLPKAELLARVNE